MNEEEKLKVCLERLRVLSEEKIQNKTPVIQALREALNIVEGELLGY